MSRQSFSWEARFSFGLYHVAASNPLVNSFAKLANFLVDDDTVVSGFWGSFILTSILRSVGYLSSDSCLPVTCLSFILHTTVWCLFESAMKLVFKRARPPQYYYRQKETGVPIPSLETMSKLPRPAKGVMLPGDQHSWPSGHTLRGFGLARLLVHDPLITNTFNNSFSNYEYGLLCVAIIIGWARMALGRHTLGDVIAGMLLGILSVDLIEPKLVDTDLLSGVILLTSIYMLVLDALAFYDFFFDSRRSKQLTWIRETLGFVDLDHETLFLFIFSFGYWVSVYLAAHSTTDFKSCSARAG